VRDRIAVQAFDDPGDDALGADDHAVTDRHPALTDDRATVIDHRLAVIDATWSFARHRNSVSDNRSMVIAGSMPAHR
jgi:hypothetical protein